MVAQESTDYTPTMHKHNFTIQSFMTCYFIVGFCRLSLTVAYTTQFSSTFFAASKKPHVLHYYFLHITAITLQVLASLSLKFNSLAPNLLEVK